MSNKNNNNMDKAYEWFAISWTFYHRAIQCFKGHDFPGTALNSQQSTEFAVKALIISLGGSPKRTHDPSFQLELFKDSIALDLISTFYEILNITSRLSHDYLPSRYPDMDSPFQLFGEKEVIHSIGLSKKVIEGSMTIICRRLSLKREEIIEEILSRITELKLNELIRETIAEGLND